MQVSVLPGSPLAYVSIALLSSKKAHGITVLDILRTINNSDYFLQSTNRVLAEHHLPSEYVQRHVCRVPITPAFDPDFVVRHIPAPSDTQGCGRRVISNSKCGSTD